MMHQVVFDQRGLSIISTLTKAEPECTVFISNPTRSEATIYPNSTIATGYFINDCKQTGESFINTIRHGGVYEETSQIDPKYKVDLSESQINEEQKSQLQKLLDEFEDIFAKNAYDLGNAKVEPMEIRTTTEIPVFSKPHRVPYNFREEFDKHIEKLVKSGAMVPSDTSWVSSIVPVKKKDGSLRMCLDLRKLNAVTLKDHFPLKTIQDVLEKVAGKQWYSSLDLAAGFLQIPLSEDASRKCGVVTHENVYQMTKMPFGLVSATAVFNRCMAQVLSGLEDESIWYVDDCLIFNSGENFEEHLNALRKVFGRFREFCMKISPQKCAFARKSLQFLGHNLNSEGYSPAMPNLKAIENFPTPNTPKKVKQFLGMAGFYHKHIPMFANIAEPLNLLLRKNQDFIWTENQENSFNKLKNALINDATLAFPDYEKPFHLFVDASKTGVPP